MKKNLILLSAIAMSVTLNTFGQNKKVSQDMAEQGFVHDMSDSYTTPDDSAVIAKLEDWQDRKFGIFFHWGVYSIPGISESWPLCSEDKFMARRRKIQPDMNYDEFKKWYWDLSKQFNPSEFNATDWAALMKSAGMKYMVFTTKHHDGFCMYDSKLTDYTITNQTGIDPLKNLIDEFRNHGFMIGTYFSKADWHSPWYWNPDKATPARGVNYDIKKHPDWWKNFCEYTNGQVDELMTNYGPIDILWLDGGWVKAPAEDLGIDTIIDNARAKQPGLIAVDRTVKGRNENYLTPEMRIPKEQLPYPWETNTTLTNRWGWTPNPKYKSAFDVINMLAEITAKGGNFLLDVGPDGKGRIEQAAIDRLNYIGNWLDKNGEAIYSTRATEIYNDGPIWFNASKDGKTIYGIFTLNDGEKLPQTIEWTGNVPTGKMTLLANGKKLKYTTKEGKTTVVLPSVMNDEPFAFKFSIKK